MKTLAPGRTETPHFGDTLLFMNKETDAKGSPKLPQAPEPPSHPESPPGGRHAPRCAGNTETQVRASVSAPRPIPTLPAPGCTCPSLRILASVSVPPVTAKARPTGTRGPSLALHPQPPCW